MRKYKMISVLLLFVMIVAMFVPSFVYATDEETSSNLDNVGSVESEILDLDVDDSSEESIDDSESDNDIVGEIEENNISNPFSDVDEEDWFYEDVMNVFAKKIMLGTSDDIFSPLLNTTRGTIVTLLYRADGSPSVSMESGFLDVEKGSWYFDAVNWAFENSLIQGYNEIEFAPNDQVTREQFITILYRYNEYITNPSLGDADDEFIDLGETDEDESVALDVDNEVSGIDLSEDRSDEESITEEILNDSIDDKSLDVNDSSSNDDPDLSSIDLTSVFSDGTIVSDYAVEAIKWAYAYNYIKGDTEGNLNPSRSAVRSQVAAIISRFLDNPSEEGELMASAVFIRNGTYVIGSSLSSKNNHYVVDVRGNSTAENTNVWIYSANYKNNQRLKITRVKGDCYKIIDSNSGLALSVAGSKKGSKVNVRIEKY